MTHPNAMTAWPEIACQRGHSTHLTTPVTVRLGGPTGYGDYPPIPQRLARSFEMEVFSPALYPVDDGVYCPAHDVVSETIASHGVWEPRETILTLDVCSAPDEGVVVDFGAQLGWFSLLAASCGRSVYAIDADRANLDVLASSAAANGWQDCIEPVHLRVGSDSRWGHSRWGLNDRRRIRFAKLDLEGAETHALRLLWPAIEGGYVDHLLVEVSPVFDDYYPDLVVDLLDAGYRAFTLPPKRRPPVPLGGVADLEPFELPTNRDAVRGLVASWRQEDCWFAHRDASW